MMTELVSYDNSYSYLMNILPCITGFFDGTAVWSLQKQVPGDIAPAAAQFILMMLHF